MLHARRRHPDTHAYVQLLCSHLWVVDCLLVFSNVVLAVVVGWVEAGRTRRAREACQQRWACCAAAALQSLVAPTPEGASGLPAFLASIAPQLVAVLVFGQKKEQMEELGAAMHAQVRGGGS